MAWSGTIYTYFLSICYTQNHLNAKHILINICNAYDVFEKPVNKNPILRFSKKSKLIIVLRCNLYIADSK